MAISPRKQLVTRLFNEGLAQIERLDVVKIDPDRFFCSIILKTGITTGAQGGMNNNRPFVYIGTRGREFDKTNSIRLYKLWAKGEPEKSVWKDAANSAMAGDWMFTEYSHIHDDPEIGKFISDAPEDHVGALVAHELSHAVHLWNVENGAENDKTAHGEAWQYIYRALRVNWINPRIK